MQLNPPSVPLASPTWISRGVSILNGMFGDYLRRRGNELAITMAYYDQDGALRLTCADLQRLHPQATSRICVLVHGLGCNEGIWSMPVRARHANTDSYGSLLQRELGYTPFYVRYNTGLPIAENGASLAMLIGELVACYPVHVDEIVLIGHSMGGLVIRHACDRATRSQAWVDCVTRMFYLGTPLNGADLEKFAFATNAVLHAIPSPITRLIGDILNLRSQGVKDLRKAVAATRNNAAAADRAAGGENAAIPWLASAQHYLLLGTLTRDPRHPLTRLFGDALVRVPAKRHRRVQAAGAGTPSERNIKVFPKVAHLQLAHDRAVYRQIKRWCSRALEAT